MSLPQFLGIGVPRAGTTWLHELLRAHPDVYVPERRKELSFFDLHYERGLGWYEKFFPRDPIAEGYRSLGEITPYYFYCEECPRRIADVGIGRLILMLRHPVDRAWSYYGQKIRNGMFRGTFEEFLGGSRWPAIEQGHYSRYFRRYLRYFDRRQILVLVFEQALADLSGTQRALANFLGVRESGFTIADAGEAVNQSYVPRAPRLYGLAFRAAKVCRELDLDWVVNAAKRLGLREAFGSTGRLAPMPTDTRHRLDTLFQPEIDALEALLEIRLDVWRRTAEPPPRRLLLPQGGAEAQPDTDEISIGVASHDATKPRPRALIFAYACEPERGSEPGAGWGLVRSFAEVADCVVLVGPEHGPGLKREGWAGDDPRLQFIEVAEPIGAASAKLHRVTWFLLYLAWLRRADVIGRRLHKKLPFDVVVHATYSTYWLPSPAVSYGVPSVWGPVGGAVVTPIRLWPALGWRGVGGELLDLFSVSLMSKLPATRRTWRRATVALVQNRTTQTRLPAQIRANSRIVNHAFYTQVPRTRWCGQGGPCLFVGSLVARKGPRLAVRALAHAPESVRLVMLGGGSLIEPLRRLAKRLRIEERLSFEGQVSRAEVLAHLRGASAVVFTGLREEGGIALAEALLVGTPVIVLAHGGAETVAAASTDPSRVALIPPGSIEETARRIGEAMGRFSGAQWDRTGPLLDQEYWQRQLHQALRDALARGAIAGNPSAGS